MTMADGIVAPTRGKGWSVALWSAQIVLAAVFGMAGVMKSFMSSADLVQMGLLWVRDAPLGLVRFIGLCELAGTIGILAPALTRIRPELTPLAALGFVAIQCLAIPFHLWRGETMPLPMNLALLALAIFVAFGRSKRVPIEPRG